MLEITVIRKFDFSLVHKVGWCIISRLSQVISKPTFYLIKPIRGYSIVKSFV